MLKIHQKTRQLTKEITEKSSGNHEEKFRKSRQLLEEITEKSSGNHGNFLRKSRRKVQLILRITDYSHDGNMMFPAWECQEIIKKGDGNNYEKYGQNAECR